MAQDRRAAVLIRLLDEVARTRGRIVSAFAEGREETGLSELEMVVLNAVAGALQPPTVPQIGRSLGHARQVIQRAAAELVGRDLARWVENPDHKRAYRLAVTEAGAALKTRADAHGLHIAERLTQGMDLPVLEQAVAALHAVRGWLEADARGLAEPSKARRTRPQSMSARPPLTGIVTPESHAPAREDR